ncbi:hypothetical protein A2U01_0012949 [Trifolium medium]|uniref:Uncharacterized protein n=1 Tax=Trifolium medium TaxID=97028 RepID=A0A392MWX0_9FABA|nr:hypothetical protein [Trifolium medium]
MHDRKEKKLWMSQEHYIKECRKDSRWKILRRLMYVMVCTRPDKEHAVGFDLEDKPTLEGFSDSYMAGDIDSRKSTLGNMIRFVGEL